MIELCTPRGIPVSVPETESEDPSPRFESTQSDEIEDYYARNGYVVVRSLFHKDVCDTQRALWDEEVKPFEGFMYRQATARAERHRLNERGWVMNPILNLQSVHPWRFPKFREFATGSVLSSPNLRSVFTALLKDTPKVVQSMYFEGNSATWEHQDTYYLDSVRVGEMAAAWIALEDIDATAGRFFICPGSHRLLLDEQRADNNIADHHDVYIEGVVSKMKELHLGIRAPALRKGDVLFWNSRTIHGSLDSQHTSRARSSITCHAIPSSYKFLQLQTLVKDARAENVNGTGIYRPKDLRHFRNRLILGLEAQIPSFFYWLKGAAISYLVSRKKPEGRKRLA
jgi:phytanoyl-CoA hydroxylase